MDALLWALRKGTISAGVLVIGGSYLAVQYVGAPWESTLQSGRHSWRAS